MRLPQITRDPSGSLGTTPSGALGLETTCAIEWYEFLADEAYFNDDVVMHDHFKARADRLKGSPKGYLYSHELESLIAQYRRD